LIWSAREEERQQNEEIREGDGQPKQRDELEEELKDLGL